MNALLSLQGKQIEWRGDSLISPGQSGRGYWEMGLISKLGEILTPLLSKLALPQRFHLDTWYPKKLADSVTTVSVSSLAGT